MIIFISRTDYGQTMSIAMTPILIASLHFIKTRHCSSQFIDSSPISKPNKFNFCQELVFVIKLLLPILRSELLNATTTTFYWLLLLINILIPFNYSPAPTSCASVHIQILEIRTNLQDSMYAFRVWTNKLKRCLSICKRVTVDIRLKMQLNINCAGGMRHSFQFTLNRKRTLM